MNRLEFVTIKGDLKEKIEARRANIVKVLCSDGLRKAALVVAEYGSGENSKDHHITVEEGSKHGYPSDYLIRIWENSNIKQPIMSINIFKDLYYEFENEVYKAKKELQEDTSF